MTVKEDSASLDKETGIITFTPDPIVLQTVAQFDTKCAALSEAGYNLVQDNKLNPENKKQQYIGILATKQLSADSIRIVSFGIMSDVKQ